MRALALTVILAACGGSKADRAVCERAADKYEVCIGELLGEEAKKMVHDKRDIGACATDDKTVEMYKTCLRETDCTKFLDCTTDYAAEHGP